MDLFAAAGEEQALAKAPLAVRMRPRSIDEYVGQQRVIGPGTLLRRVILGDRPLSLILYGPPGTGKTTLARLMAESTRSHFEQINAVTSGVADIRRVIQEAKERRALYDKGSIVFIDEIHRFNKAQQDALLPAVEDGTIVLIGATTENPYFEVNAPLLSRARVVRLEPLKDEEIRTLIHRALADEERGLGTWRLSIENDAETHLIRVASGDARVALNALELAALGAKERPDRTITVELAEEATERKFLRYDKDGDNHYDVISAFIKSMRGGDPDATLYWLARMLESGEDPRFIARRILIHASEDVGNADPHAIVVAAACATALEWVGLPEAELALAQAALYIATAPKSNAVCVALAEAKDAVRAGSGGEVPKHLRDAHYPGAAQLGHGKGYLYPHDYEGGYVPQQYLPDGMEPVTFYRPTDRGYERTIRERLAHWRRRRLEG